MSKDYFDNALQAMFDLYDKIFEKQHEIFENNMNN